MTRSTRLVILIKNIYTLWGRKFPSACYILSDESSIPFYSTSNGYKNILSGNYFLKNKKANEKIKFFF